MKTITSFIIIISFLATGVATAGILPTPVDLGILLFPPGQLNMQPYRVELDPANDSIVVEPQVSGDSEKFTYDDVTGKGLLKIQQTLFTVQVNEVMPLVTFTQYIHTGATYVPYAITPSIPGVIEGDIFVDGISFHVVIDQNISPAMVLVSVPGTSLPVVPVYAQSNYAVIVSGDTLFAIEPNSPTPGTFRVHKWMQYHDGWTDGVYQAPSLPSNVGHIVISEIQLAASSTTDDFIELYNPTDMPINLDGYRLVRRALLFSDVPIKAFSASNTIPARGYYLWANSGYTNIAVQPDATTTAALANNNGIALRFGPENTGTIIDSVAWGTSNHGFGEGMNLAGGLLAGQSYERNLWQGITCFSPQGVGELLGNGCDRNNNSWDFEVRSASNPQNSLSASEP